MQHNNRRQRSTDNEILKIHVVLEQRSIAEVICKQFWYAYEQTGQMMFRIIAGSNRSRIM